MATHATPAAGATLRVRHAEYGLTLGILGVAALGLLLWALVPVSFLVPAPAPTLAVLYEGLVTQGWLLAPLRATFYAVLVGFGIAVVAGVTAGVLLGRSPYWRAVWEPILLNLYSIPKITLYPVLLVLWGTNVESRIAMGFIHAVFPLLISTMVGVAAVRPIHVKVARMVRASTWQTVWKIYFPSMAPLLVSGVRMGFSLGIIGVILSELFAAKEGLGQQLIKSYAILNVERMFAIILLLFVIALGANMSLWALEKRLRARAA